MLSTYRLQSLLDRINANNTNDFLLNDNNISINEDANTYQNIEDLLESILFLISNEKSKIQNDKTNLINLRQRFKEEIELRLINHQKDIDNWKKNVLIAQNMQCNDNDILELNIGGMKYITTTRKTLTKYPSSALAAMFSGRHKLPYHNGKIFIDRMEQILH